MNPRGEEKVSTPDNNLIKSALQRLDDLEHKVLLLESVAKNPVQAIQKNIELGKHDALSYLLNTSIDLLEHYKVTLITEVDIDSEQEECLYPQGTKRESEHYLGDCAESSQWKCLDTFATYAIFHLNKEGKELDQNAKIRFLKDAANALDIALTNQQFATADLLLQIDDIEDYLNNNTLYHLISFDKEDLFDQLLAKCSAKKEIALVKSEHELTAFQYAVAANKMAYAKKLVEFYTESNLRKEISSMSPEKISRILFNETVSVYLYLSASTKQDILKHILSLQDTSLKTEYLEKAVDKRTPLGQLYEDNNEQKNTISKELARLLGAIEESPRYSKPNSAGIQPPQTENGIFSFLFSPRPTNLPQAPTPVPANNTPTMDLLGDLFPPAANEQPTPGASESPRSLLD